MTFAPGWPIVIKKIFFFCRVKANRTIELYKYKTLSTSSFTQSYKTLAFMITIISLLLLTSYLSELCNGKVFHILSIKTITHDQSKFKLKKNNLIIVFVKCFPWFNLSSMWRNMFSMFFCIVIKAYFRKCTYVTRCL